VLNDLTTLGTDGNWEHSGENFPVQEQPIGLTFCLQSVVISVLRVGEAEPSCPWIWILNTF